MRKSTNSSVFSVALRRWHSVHVVCAISTMSTEKWGGGEGMQVSQTASQVQTSETMPRSRLEESHGTLIIEGSPLKKSAHWWRIEAYKYRGVFF